MSSLQVIVPRWCGERLLKRPGPKAWVLIAAGQVLFFGLTVGLALFGPTARASPTQDPVAQFASGVQLVEVYATVTDEKGEPLTGLRQSDFEVYENDERQQISTFASGEFPVTIALGIDRSWSMAGEPLRLAKRASQAFLDRLRPDDRALIVAISSEAEVISPLGADPVLQGRAIAELRPWGTTALHDAIITTLDRIDPERGRQALIVFSDGADRYSRATSSEVLDRARRSHALIYPIAFGKTRPPLLAELALLTGGRSFALRDPRDLEKTLATIAHELRFQYLIGYAPSDSIQAGTLGWRSIRVALTRGAPGIRVRARDGYFIK